MNAAVLKLLATLVIGFVVLSSLWLANSVQARHDGRIGRLAQNSPQTSQLQRQNLPLMALPAERAASAAAATRVVLR